jgi:prevent-host-death family protein
MVGQVTTLSDVGVRELKQRLSEYLARAERGEVIRVTDRGRPKAVLGPLPGRVRIEEGWLTPGSGLPLGAVDRVEAKRSTLEVLAEDRGE